MKGTYHRRSGVWITALALCLVLAGAARVEGPQAFAPTNFKGLGSNTHQSITEGSVTALDKEFFSVSKLSRTMKKAMEQITDANAAVDDDQSNSALHFDNENFAGGQSRLIDLFNRTLSDVRAKNAQGARTDLGGALHTLQDFYAHSNWVELGNGGANPDLGRPGHTIGNVAGPSEATCNGSTLTTTKLTSGYYGGERPLPAVTTKCRHGGPFDKGPGSGGINKDFRLSTLSPHASFHNAAAAAARQATDQFIRDIKAQITQAQLRLLLGAGPTLGMAIDTTGSMGSIINGVKSQATQIVDARVGTDEEPAKYVLAPFNDPDTGPTTVTEDPGEFKSAIGGLFASGGDDCPELAMTGMLEALGPMDKGGDLFMFTDATAKDSSLAGNVSSLADANEVTVYPVLFGSCSPIDPGYIRVANDTGGQVFVLPRSGAAAITQLADFVVRANAVDVLSIAGDLGGATRTVTVPVDSTMSRVTFSASGASSLVVTRPDGSVVQAGDPGVRTVTLAGSVPASIVSVSAPAVGVWRATLAAPSTYSLNVTGESSLDLSSFRFLHEVAGHEGPFDEPLPGFPVPGRATDASATVGGTFASAGFEFRAPDGTRLQTVSLTPVDDPAVGEFAGSVVPPAAPFRVYVTGTDAGGNAFQRALPAVVQPQTLVVTPPAPAPLRPGQTTTLTFQVQNLGAADVFGASVSDDKGYVRSYAASFATLGAGDTGTVTIQVQPPAGTPDGTSDTVTVDVSSAAAHNFAVLTNQVVSAPADTTPPTTTATATPPANAAGWNSGTVTVALHAVDDAGGSGVRSISYAATGAQAIAATDVGGDSATIVVSAEGVTTLTFSATDEAGNAEATQTLTIRIDETPPALACAAVPATLWPPDHKLAPVQVFVTNTDALSGTTGFRLVSASTADPTAVAGDIAGFTVGEPSVSGSLRAERAGNQADRVYTLAYEAADVAGNVATCRAQVTVPHDQR